MGFYDTINAIINPVLAPLLNLGPFWAVLLISFVIAVLITFVYKWMTDQDLMKTLKEDIKTLQKEMKQLRNNPAKMMEVQKKAMEKNMKYMMHSMRPTLITFIPLILIFGWLNAHMGYYPINPGQEFTTTAYFNDYVTGPINLITPEGLTILSQNPQNITNSKAIWTIKGEKGEYQLNVRYQDKEYSSEVIITDQREYKQPVKLFKKEPITKIEVGYEKIVVLNLFGWKLGWLGTYIIFSIIFSMSLRKMLKIH